TPRPASHMRGRRAGLVCERFPGSFDVLPELEGKRPATRYEVRAIELPHGLPEENIVRRYQGYVDVPREGVWELALVSDDGSKLWLDDALLIDNDGLHGRREKRAVAALARGPHALRVEWFNKTGGADLSVRLGEAGGPLLPIPEEAYSHDVASGEEPVPEE